MTTEASESVISTQAHGKPMKPNIAFLQKVEAGRVASVKGYSAKKGAHWYFIGGELTAMRHAAAAFIKMPGIPELGRPAIATLTDAGRAAIAEATNAKCKMLD